ncbi:FecR domain-containing protein [Flammeovirga aprica]|uniref:FecR family protein n=1 Tax=Flammeovirga aprica JL-4 TaxID=694437 RepID=A0A7X9RVR9_9BACT|nr:FecR domain-containing protein [Flammeovirga aprica]NME69601.1 FecR family protein [Flammeovirga aprica JL-4]
MSENDFINKGNDAFKDGKNASLSSSDEDEKLLKKISDYTDELTLPESKMSHSEAWEKVQKNIRQNTFEVEHNPNVFEKLLSSKTMTRVAAVVGVLVGIYTLWFFSNDIEQVASNDGTLEYTFPDGSVAMLKKGSSVQFLKAGFDRQIYLDGHAQFYVNDDGGENRTFEVKTDRTVVFAHDGSQFDLRDDQHIFQLTNLGESPILYIEEHSADKKLMSLESGMMLETFSTDLSAPIQRGLLHTKWVEGNFSYFEAPIVMVIEDLEKQFGVVIEHELHTLDLIFTGDFQSSSIESALTEICSQVSLEFMLEGEKILLREKE